MQNKKRENQINKRKTVAGFNISMALFSILAMFIVATVFFAIEASTLGAHLAELENEEIALNKEKQEYSNQLINSSSLSGMGEKAEQLGFIKPSDVIYISEKEAVAKLP
ncbi:hypothetical protein KKH23_00510 [Patescibacteria group bacterium]|nr:hypothetical protein [Patescibacteria group bacterium]MBU0776957.1 hypothetical protein [Patescibacteria group bacterium]MBU0845675.1 hypothetical protein [Patescibacteria group bacterium]MBU0922986.1 hypothetical protein [Patescibacteria group bacterium]MBU1066919.1 hypothetical protein [Patescibacteria group bacterium]